MAQRTFPRPDSDFAAYMNNYFDGVKQWFDAQGLDPAQWQPLQDALVAWRTAYPAHVAAQAAAEAARAAKDDARAALQAAARPITAFIQGYPTTTDAQRATIGITVRDQTATPAGTPTTRPLPVVRDGGRFTHTLRLSDESTPTRRARPRGTIGAEVWVKLVPPGEATPTDPTLLHFLTMATGPTITTEFKPADGGKTAVYMLRWVSTRGEKGPWSDVVTGTVAA